MEDSQKLALFHESGIFHFNDSTAVFIDPVRVLNRSYNRHTVSPSTYYPRFFQTLTPKTSISTTVSSSPPKRKRKKRKRTPKELNQREQIAFQRHQVFY